MILDIHTICPGYLLSSRAGSGIWTQHLPVLISQHNSWSSTVNNNTKCATSKYKKSRQIIRIHFMSYNMAEDLTHMLIRYKLFIQNAIVHRRLNPPCQQIKHWYSIGCSASDLNTSVSTKPTWNLWCDWLISARWNLLWLVDHQ